MVLWTLGLEIGKHISADFRTLYVMQKAKRGEIQPYLKTKNGAREVDLCLDLAAMLKEYVGERTEGCCPNCQRRTATSNALRASLHPVLTKLEHVQGGFNFFRRYRITYLEKSDCPDSLKHFWSGHAQKHISERYVKLIEEREYRLEWAERIGLGFKIPTSAGLLGLLCVVSNAA
jgi:hypothetical protein